MPFAQSMLPKFHELKPESIQPSIGTILEANRSQLQNLLSQDAPYTWDNLMQPLESMSDELNKAWSPIGHMNATMETAALREAYNAILPVLTAYQTEFSQNEALYQAILSIFNSPEFKKLNAAQQKIIEDDIRDFKLSGVHLDAIKKARLADLQQQLSQQMTKFSQNLLDATNGWILPITDKAQLAGLPEQALELAVDNAKRRGLEGYVLTLDYPSYSTAMKFLRDRSLRRTLYEAYITRASETGPNGGKWDNSSVMDAILQIRHEMAHLVGFDNFALYSLATKMAKTPSDVLGFLNDLLARSKPLAQTDYNELLVAAKKDGVDDLAAWDIAYYSEQLQVQKFDFTQEDFRPYFPIDQVLEGLFTLVQRLYGIRIEAQLDIEVWHPDVRFYSITDETGQVRGGFYIDLYARQHKRDGAWMDDCRTRRRLNKNDLQYPVAFLTCNFMPPVNGQPALLTHDDVLTLFHEFGHCLHHLLTTVDYAPVAGINGVPWDAVEFPSQFMENYCWEKESVALISGHYKTGEKIPDALFEKLVAAKHFQTGLQMVRQLEFALFDFKIHLEYDPGKPDFIQSTLNAVREKTAVIPISTFNRFQHSFAHIFAGGYAAGYYSYKWAEVLSADAYAAFEEKGILDQATGRSFMHNILEVGGVRDPMVSFVAFRGRPPTIDALLKQSGIV